MNNMLKIDACVYSRIGLRKNSNTDGFYMNGKFISERYIDNIQAEIENSGAEYVFAVSDKMEYRGIDSDSDSEISVLKEMGKFHEKITVNGGDLEFKIKEMVSKVTETSKLIQSIATSSGRNTNKIIENMGFGGLLLSEGKAVALNCGTCRVYFMREGIFKHMTVDYSKAKRLLDLGIISDEQAETLNEKFGVQIDKDINKVDVSDTLDIMEGDKFLICSDGLAEVLEDEEIESILYLRSDSTYLAYKLVNEALKKGAKDDITSMVIRIEKVKTANIKKAKPVKQHKNVSGKSVKPPVYKHFSKKRGFQKYEGIATFVLAVLTTAVLLAIVGLLIKSMFGISKRTVAITPSPLPTQTAPPTPTVEPTLKPTPVPTPEPTPVSAEIERYKVKAGDSMYKIAKQYYGNGSLYKKLAKYNNIDDPSNIKLGQIIKIPPKDQLP